MALEGLTVGRSDSNQRVVVPSDVVDAMISEQASGGSGELAVAEQMPEVEMAPEAQPAAVEEPVISAPASRPASADENVQQENTRVAEPVAEAVAETVSEVAAAVPATVMGAELQAINQRHYALQLAALKSMSAASNFVADYDIADIATVYETRRNGEPWFIIVTGDYPDMVSARKAETRLPARLRAVQPWVKSYAQIHREIERAK